MPPFKLIDESAALSIPGGLLTYGGGTVCDDYFSDNSANAVCKMMGYEGSSRWWKTESVWDVQRGVSVTVLQYIVLHIHTVLSVAANKPLSAHHAN